MIQFGSMWSFLGGALGALGSVFGADKQADTTAQTNAMNYQIAQQTNAQNMAINQQNIAAQEQMNQENIANQLNFAQNSPGWALSDLVSTAKNVGINPLAALGVGGTSFTNQVAPQASQPMQTGNKMVAPDIGSLYSNAGQALGRAIGAIQSPEDQAYDQTNKMLTLQRGQLENDFLRSKINALNAPGNPPGVPNFSSTGVKAGVEPDVQYSQDPDGGLSVIPPKEISQLGFFHPASLSWYARNGLLPAFGENLPAGKSAVDFNPFTMSYPAGGTYMGNLYKRLYVGR